jgi:hypothetical protein
MDLNGVGYFKAKSVPEMNWDHPKVDTRWIYVFPLERNIMVLLGLYFLVSWID